MKCTDRWILGILLLWLVLPLQAQDLLPEKVLPDKNSRPVFNEQTMARMLGLIDVQPSMPLGFQHTQENEICDPERTLDLFWDKLMRMEGPVRIVHIGDSHVRGHVLPYVVRKQLEAEFGSDAVVDQEITYRSSGLAEETGERGIVYHMLGVNGATYGTYYSPERVYEIASLNPDLIIVSFGTNEAHAPRYTAGQHIQQMKTLLDALKQACPQSVFLLTTPPGAYKRQGRRGRVINTQTPQVVATEQAYARDNRIAIWDMYDIVGGKQRACQNWLAGNYYQKDRIHFTHQGYTVQGLLLHEALIKAYNKYVETQFAGLGNRLE